MDASGSSQLSQYLKSLSLAPAIKLSIQSAPGPGPSAVFELKCFVYSAITDVWSALSCEIVFGVCRDIVFLMELTSDSLTELSTTFFSSLSRSTTSSQSKMRYTGGGFDHLRRFFLIALVVSFCTCPFNVNTNYSLHAFFGTMSSAIFWVALVFLAIPIVIGTVFNWLIKSMLGKMKRTESAACYLLGWIKRLQITSLGRQITHPMPPVAKIEESVREICGSMILSCPETRQAMHFALISFSQDLRSAMKSFRHTSEPLQECWDSDADRLESNSVPSISQLQSLSSKIFTRRTLGCYREVLLCIEMSSCDAGDSTASKAVALLSLPMCLIDIISSIDRFHRRLLLICRETESDVLESSFRCSNQAPSDRVMDSAAEVIEGRVNAAYGTAINRASIQDHVCPQSDSSDVSHAQPSHSVSERTFGDSDGRRTDRDQTQAIASAYTDIRLQLLRHRHAAECTLNTLWLCEQELSKKEVTRLLHHQAVLSGDDTGDGDKHNSDSQGSLRNRNKTVDDDSGVGVRVGVIDRLHRAVALISSPHAEQRTLGDSAQPLCDQLLHLISLIKPSGPSDLQSACPSSSSSSFSSSTSSSSSTITSDPLERQAAHLLMPRDRGSCMRVPDGVTCAEAAPAYESVNQNMANTDSNSLINGDLDDESQIAKVYIATIPAVDTTSTSLLHNNNGLSRDGGSVGRISATRMHTQSQTQSLLSELHSHIHTMCMSREVVEKIVNLDLDDICTSVTSDDTYSVRTKLIDTAHDYVGPSSGIISSSPSPGSAAFEEPSHCSRRPSCTASVEGEGCDDQTTRTQEVDKPAHTVTVAALYNDYNTLSLSNELSAVLSGVRKMEDIQFSIDTDDDDDDDDSDDDILKELDYIEVEGEP
jgi:hypothetical protein